MAPKSYQIAHIYCLFFLMVVVCIANRDTDNTVKASKFNKDIYINLAKNEEYKEMKKCILVWQVPVIEGEPYNPVEYAVYVRKAKKFAEALNRYFAELIYRNKNKNIAREELCVAMRNHNMI